MTPLATRRLVRKAKAGQPISLRDAFDACPYRTLLGLPPCAPKLVAAFAILESDDPEPLTPEEVTEVVAALAAGGTILLMATHCGARDRAKAQVIAAGAHLHAAGAA